MPPWHTGVDLQDKAYVPLASNRFVMPPLNEGFAARPFISASSDSAPASAIFPPRSAMAQQ